MALPRLLLPGLTAAFVFTAATASAAVNPPVLKWQRGGCFGSWCQTGWYASPAVADLDADGQPEVIWGSYDVVVLNGSTGTLRARGANGSRVWPGIAVADLSGDGTLEIVVGRGANQLHVYRFDPASSVLPVLWSRNPFANNCAGNGCEVRTLAVEDLERDGQLEVVVGRASGGSVEQLNAYDAFGNQRPGWPARRSGEVGFGWGMYNQNVTIADLNGDGLKEVVGPTDTHYITALDRNGNQLPTHSMFDAFNPAGPKPWSRVGVHVDLAADLRGYANCGTEHRPNFANSAPAVADVDGDGTLEIVVVGDVYNCALGDPAGDLYHLPWILRQDRSRWAGGGFDWTVIPAAVPGSGPLSQDYNVIQNSVQNVVVADLDADGRKEILYPSYDGRLHAYWLDKTQHGNWPYRVPGSGIRFASEPVVADLDGDGPAEVIFTSWPENGGGRIGQLHILDHLGNPLQVVDLPAPFGGTWNGGLAAPTLANIDSDADLEVVVGTTGSGVVAYDLPGTASARILWGTGRGSLRRTGVAPQRVLDVGLVLRSGTGSGTSEVHVMSGARIFQTWRLNAATQLPATGDGPDWWFLRGDYNRDGREDLYCIKKAATGSGRTEVHVMNGRNGSWLANIATVLHETGTDASWVFALADYDNDGFLDLHAVRKSGTGSGRTEVHVMSGATAFQSWLLQAATPLAQLGNDAGVVFLAGDYNRDGRSDLYAVVRQPPSGQTEVHVLNGANGFQGYLANVATALPATGTDVRWMFVLGDYNGDGAQDVYAILKAGTGSGKTEVHVLDGATAFQRWLLHAATVAPMYGTTWGAFFVP